MSTEIGGTVAAGVASRVVRARIALFAGILICGACGTGTIRPSVGTEAVLDRFTRIQAEADSMGQVQRSVALGDIIQLLKLSAPTNALTLQVDGRRLRFTAVTALAEIAGSPDSVYALSAWRGANADTTLEMTLTTRRPVVESAAARPDVASEAAAGARTDSGLGVYSAIEFAIGDSSWSASTPNIDLRLHLGAHGRACESVDTTKLWPAVVISCVRMRYTSAFAATLTDARGLNPRRVAMEAAVLQGIDVRLSGVSLAQLQR